MDAKFITGKLGGKVLLYDNHKYHKKSIMGTKAYFDCSCKRTRGCKAAVQLNGFDSKTWEYTELKCRPQPHNHSPDDNGWKRRGRPKKETDVPILSEKNDEQQLKIPDALNLLAEEEDTEINLDIVKQEMPESPPPMSPPPMSPTPTVSENDTSEIAPDKNKSTKLCLICNSTMEHKGATFRINRRKWLSNSQFILNRHLCSMFVVRKVLKLSHQECCQLLSNSADLNPGDWFVLCRGCCILAANAYKLECKVVTLNKKLESFKSLLTAKLGQSLGEENGTSFENVYNQVTRNALRSCFKNKSNNVFNKNLGPENQFASYESEPDHDWDDFADDSYPIEQREQEVETDKDKTVSSKKPKPFRQTSKVFKRQRVKQKNLFGKVGDIFKCYRCPYTSSKRSTLRRHAYDHTVMTRHCDLCNYPALTDKRLISHKKKYHEPKLNKNEAQLKPELDTTSHMETEDVHNNNLSPASPEAYDDFTQTNSPEANGEKLKLAPITITAKPRLPRQPSALADKLRKLKRNRYKPKEKLFGKEGDLFKCYQCPYSSKKYSTVRRHAYDHRLSTTKCDLCNFPVLNDQRLQLHINKYHKLDSAPTENEHENIKLDPDGGTDNLLADLPEASSNLNQNSIEPNVGNLKTNKIEIIVHERRPNGSAKKEKLRRFKRNSIKTQYSMVGNEYKCHRCPFSSFNYSTMRRHAHDHIASPQKCELCTCPLSSAGTLTLILHMKKYHPDQPLPKKKPKVKCPKCSFEGVFNFDIKIHMKKYHDRLDNVDIDHELSIYRCKLCPKVFDNEDMTLRHVGRFHKSEIGGTPHLCHICAKSYGSVNTLRKHVRFCHTGEKRHKCDVCDALFHTAPMLRKHKARHLSKEEKSLLICDECGHRFETQGGLRRHQLKVHFLGVPKIIKQEVKGSGETAKQMTCKHCGLSCIHVQALKAHMTDIHPELFSFECDVCGNRYVSSKNLRLHMKKAHGHVF